MRRTLAGLLCGIFVAVLLLSGALVSAHAGHNCKGVDCAICEAMQQCQALLRNLVAALAGISLVFCTVAARHAFSQLYAFRGGEGSLVSLKVKLSC